jgi:AraC family transcriptional regulator
MEWLERMSSSIDYIERNITENILYDEVAKLACCSMHQFGRVFSYIVGVSLSEYIRRRRLTLAALELQGSQTKVIDVALKYGYESPDAFTRAFQNMHGITPKEARTLGVKLKAYPRITFQLTIKGVDEMEYRIVEMPDIQLVGMVKQIERQSANHEAKSWKESMGTEWEVWHEFLNQGMDQRLSKAYHAPLWQMGFTKTLENGESLLAIGAETNVEDYPDLQTSTIPAGRWAVFSVKGSLSKSEHPIDAMWTRITMEWFPASGYVRSNNYEIQVYPPGNTDSNDYISEIWIPVESK